MAGFTFGPNNKRLSELTDGELRQEALRRRAARGAIRSPGGDPLRHLEERRRVARWYANLELEPGAPLETVKASYRRLVEQFHPDQHASDPEKHRAATELIASLTKAYEALVDHLGDGRVKGPTGPR